MNLKYAFLTDTGWSVEMVDSAGPVGAYCSLALRFGVVPCISYRDGNNFDLKLARKTSGEWQFELVDTLGDVGWCSSIAIGSDGHPRIAYYESDQRGFRFTRWTGSMWEYQSVDPLSSVSSRLALSLDSYDYPHVTYWDEDHDALKHAYWDGSAWLTETVDDLGYRIGYFNGIAIDMANSVHVVYSSDPDTVTSNSELRYARRGPTAVDETVPRLRVGDSDTRLLQNLPNPFYGSTLISYSLRATSDITLSICDITGRLVETLVNEIQQPGIHQVRWNRESNPSGVYFYRLKAGESISTKKMVVVE
jgi:hypothetical protein